MINTSCFLSFLVESLIHVLSCLVKLFSLGTAPQSALHDIDILRESRQLFIFIPQFGFADISPWASWGGILWKQSMSPDRRGMVSACPSVMFILITWLGVVQCFHCVGTFPFWNWRFVRCALSVWSRGFAQYLRMIWTHLKMSGIVWFCNCLSSWGFNLLFSYSDTNMCPQIHLNLTVLEKHWCNSSRDSQMNVSGDYKQILHVGKDESLTCHLNFPKSFDVDSIKWYKVKKGFSC